MATPNSNANTNFQKIMREEQKHEHKSPMFNGFTLLASPSGVLKPMILPLNS